MIIDPSPELANKIAVVSGETHQRTGRSGTLSSRVCKRVIDILVSLSALTLLAPVLCAAILAVIVNSPGTPFFIQHRVGLMGKRFSMIKLRTMMIGAHLYHQPSLKKQKSDSRVFPVGSFLRRTSIDELPNLLNVLWGDMSLVGPRPMLENEFRICVERHGHESAMQRLLVKPGITGLWQISGRANLHFDERVELDITYALNWTLLGDIKILLKTIPVLFLSRGAF